MINDIVIFFLNSINTFYTNLGLSTRLNDLITKLNKPFDYVEDFKYYLSGVYYIFGKTLIMYIIGVAIVVIAVRLIVAIINLVKP